MKVDRRLSASIFTIYQQILVPQFQRKVFRECLKTLNFYFCYCCHNYDNAIVRNASDFDNDNALILSIIPVLSIEEYKDHTSSKSKHDV